MDRSPPAPSTIAKRSYHICAFLNYMLHNTSINYLHEVNRNCLRGFLVSFREARHQRSRTVDDWKDGIRDVMDFLYNYYLCNHEIVTFQYIPTDLFREERVMDRYGKGRSTRIYNLHYVSPPAWKPVKIRMLPEGYLPLLLLQAKVHDPMLALGIAFQAYGGLREAEVVNVPCGGAYIQEGAFKQISSITIDLSHPAPFARNWDKKTGFGNIKSNRRQDIYTDFLDETAELLQAHLNRLSSAGMDTGPESPLFVNSNGEPMSVNTYTDRLKKLFYQHFLPELIRITTSDGTWPDHECFITAYEKEYPGAHALRHWFTMYLVVHAGLDNVTVSRLRGDKSLETLEDYLHINASMLKLYEESTCLLQRWILEHSR